MKIPIASENGFLDRIINICEACYPKPKVLMLNYPHNPTGVVTDKEFFREVVKLAKRFNFMVINDFAYSKITFDGYQAPSFLEVEGARDVGVEFGSFSKSYNMAGWRIGYCVGNEQIVKALGKIGSMQSAIEMMNLANVAVAPGIGFSEEGEGYLRLALVENEERLKQAVRQMKKAMSNMNN
jgi:aspartate/methionine/tyrosine aminotransferase